MSLVKRGVTASSSLATRIRNGIVIAAPHGGGIERGNSAIALAMAGDDLTYHLFESRRSTENGTLHISIISNIWLIVKLVFFFTSLGDRKAHAVEHPK
jgi:hypothetical protein